MVAFSNYLEEQLLTHILRTSSFTKPSALYIALCTAAPSDTDTGSTITEVSGGSYSRQQLDPLDANWTDPSLATQGESDNTSLIDFGTATADWGTITHVVIVDASSGGNMLFHGALTASALVTNGDGFRFPVGDLNIALN